MTTAAAAGGYQQTEVMIFLGEVNFAAAFYDIDFLNLVTEALPHPLPFRLMD